MLEKLYAELKDSSSESENKRPEGIKEDEIPKRPYEYFKEQINKRQDFKFGYCTYLMISLF